MNLHEEALHAVRKTLEATLAGKDIPSIVFHAPEFKEKRGVFVTLKKNGQLRGCIGLIRGIKPLGEAIQEMAVSAAIHDPRFPRMVLGELIETSIEISILSPLKLVEKFDEIKIGRDGLLLQTPSHSGLLLPQVATEYNWDRDTFLANLCIKAGLPPGAHEEPAAKLFRFSADVFGESQPEQTSC